MRMLGVFGLIVLTVVAVALIHLQFGGPPDPRLGGCDPNDIVGSQAIELQSLSNWLLLRELLGAVAIAASVYFLFYFQIFHRLPVPFAWLGRALIIGILPITSGYFVKGLAQSWVSNAAGTCLSEAMQVNSTALATVGRFVPVGWPWAIYVDAVMLSLLGAVVGLLAYSAARQARA